MFGRPSSLWTEQMLMILPRLRAIMWRATAWPFRNTLSRLVRISSCQCSTVKSSSGPRRCMPALLIRMSMAPMVFSMSSTAAADGLAVGDVEGLDMHGCAFVAQGLGGGLELVLAAGIEDDGGAGLVGCRRARRRRSHGSGGRSRRPRRPRARRTARARRCPATPVRLPREPPRRRRSRDTSRVKFLANRVEIHQKRGTTIRGKGEGQLPLQPEERAHEEAELEDRTDPAGELADHEALDGRDVGRQSRQDVAEAPFVGRDRGQRQHVRRGRVRSTRKPEIQVER